MIPEAASAIGAVAIRLLGMPLLRCRRGHREFLTGDLDLVLAGAVERHLVHAATVRLRRYDRCAACAARLDLAPRTTERPVPVEVPGGVVTVIVEGPMVRCGECGQEQVPSDVAAQVRRGITASADAARR